MAARSLPFPLSPLFPLLLSTGRQTKLGFAKANKMLPQAGLYGGGFLGCFLGGGGFGGGGGFFFGGGAWGGGGVFFFFFCGGGFGGGGWGVFFFSFSFFFFFFFVAGKARIGRRTVQYIMRTGRRADRRLRSPFFFFLLQRPYVPDALASTEQGKNWQGLSSSFFLPASLRRRIDTQGAAYELI